MPHKPMQLREDCVFKLHDGFYCMVAGRTYGPWAMKRYAEAGLATEQRRHAAKLQPNPECFKKYRDKWAYEDHTVYTNLRGVGATKEQAYANWLTQLRKGD